jgi:hypothetical protein
MVNGIMNTIVEIDKSGRIVAPELADRIISQ